MTRRSPVLETLARLYEASTQGQTGAAARDFGVRYDRLLKEANCENGDCLENARSDLLEAEQHEMLTIERERRSSNPQRVIVPFAFEAALYARIGRSSPTTEREAWAAVFKEASSWSVPQRFAESWRAFCRQREIQSMRGVGWKPFRRTHRDLASIQLRLLPDLLAWNHPALLKTVSARISGDSGDINPSKFLEIFQGTFCSLLAEATSGAVKSFADLGISDNPRSITFHGPVRVKLGGVWSDYSAHSSAMLSEDDLNRAEIECDAPRCVTVENETKFHELCRLHCGDLFVFTSYPNRATVEFLRRLPATMPRFHFGDTDPWGFDVLRSLRAASAPVTIAPLHMEFRTTPNDSALNERDQKKLAQILTDASLADVRTELERMYDAGTKGEQETILVFGQFPYAQPLKLPP